ncbi:MAG: response regulator [Oscillatoriales cyanobacterium]|nr:MAG: response regulator [Oscillatoriales cyanobacterium]TAE04483.1 MAG: response regulator [Oscillatoriales cyanobacterium]TAF06550.1 MAG: response regulator [Oscillatoriales cyanobacterium]TAF66604.1 MAG: response regulator [Oscillatoriales cyanobacterium]
MTTKLRATNTEKMERDLQQLRADQELILDQVDNAIALFDSSDSLVLFNQKLAKTWGIAPEWLATKPKSYLLFAEIVDRGYWSLQQWEQFQEALEKTVDENLSFYFEQSNAVCLEVCATITNSGGRLFTFRDVTVHHNSQASLNAEVRRLTFLLGLTERLQNSKSLQEIGRFALSYLVEAMNAAFGDVKVISGKGNDRQAAAISNQISTQFLASYGEPVVAGMQELLDRGISYGTGLLWEVVATGKPLFVEDYAKHPNAVPQFRHPGIGQLGIFPIAATDGTIIGVLTLESRNVKKLQTPLHQDVLEAACRTLGAAIERAQAQEDLRQVNQQLEYSSQLKSEFLASMSHELRTPLNSILGFSDLLLRQTAGQLSNRQIQYVELIEKSGQHLLQLINDILDLSKIESGKTELNLQPVPVHELATDCLKMIQPRADKKRIALSLELDYRITKVLLDERRVRQMVINLLSNAVKFTPEQGRVKLSGRLAYGNEINGDYRPDCSPVNASTPYFCFEVKDSGIGIPEDRWHLLFRPFQQVDSSLTRRHEGTGLGLALTKRLAELHGGTVSFQSICDRGSLFRVWLPLTEMRQELATSAASPLDSGFSSASAMPSPIGSKRILVVEDQPFNQMLISEVLELEGYAVEMIADGSGMLDRISAASAAPELLPDLILMDIQLPDVDGFELMRRVKADPLWKSVPMIAVTAMAMPGDRDRCLEAGASDYLSKPLDLNLAIATVRSFLS